MWGEGRGGRAWQSIRGGKTRRRRRRGAAKLGWGVKEREGGCKKKGKRCKERAQGSLCVLVAEESKWDQGGGGEGGRGVQGSRGGVDTSEQSRKLAEERNTEEGKSASPR